MTKRKGVIRAIEGVIAAVLLLGYASSFLDFPEIRVKWEESTIRQQGFEYISTIENTNIEEAIVENRGSTFLEITKHFLGLGKGYSLATRNIIKPILTIGVLANPEDVDDYLADGPDPCPLPGMSEINEACYSGTAELNGGRQIIAADKAIDGFDYYDSVFIQVSGTYIGPYKSGSIFNISVGTTNKYFQVENVEPKPVLGQKIKVSFLEADEVNRIAEKISLAYAGKQQDTSINTRAIDFRISGVIATQEQARASDVLIMNPNYDLADPENKNAVL